MDKGTIDICLLFIEAIQLPIVLIIILSSNNFVSLTKGFENNNWILTKNPLVFISISFIINFSYLITQILDTLFIKIYNLDLEKLGQVLDVLTTCSLIIASIIIYFRIKQDYLYSDENFIKSKNTLYRLTFLISFFLVISLFFKYKYSELILDIYHSAGRIFAGFYIYKLMSVYKLETHKTKITPWLVLSIGFIIWALIQFVPLFENLISLTTINRFGFSFSTLSKSMILYGFYRFYIKYAKSIANKLKNDREKLEKLQDKINEISNIENIEKLEKKVCEHLIDYKSGVFDFEYVIFSEVNYAEMLIKFKEPGKQDQSPIESPEKWVLDNITFDSADILAKVYNTSKEYHIQGNIVNGKEIDINSKKSLLNREVYIKYNHQDLNRIILPVKDIKNNSNRVVAIIEAGYFLKDAAKFPSAKINIDGALKLYFDNLSQTYEKLVDIDIKKDIEKHMGYCYTSSGDNHNEYLRLVIEKITEILKIDFGLFVLDYTNKEENEINKFKIIVSKNDYDNKKQRDIESIIKRYKKTDEIKNHVSLKKELKNLLKYEHIRIESFKLNVDVDINLILFSSISNLEFENIELLLDINNRKLINKTYLEKKLHYFSTLLINPNDAITDLDVNMIPNIELLEEYFETSLVSIWIKTNSSNYIQRHISKGIEKIITDLKLIEIENIKLSEKEELISFNPENKTSINDDLIKYAKKLKSNKILIKSIRNQHQQIGFITVFFKYKSYLVNEDINFLNLTSNKIQITIQTHNLIDAYKEISNSLTNNNQEDTLQKITDKALDILNADPIFLFKCNDGENVFFKDATHSKKIDFFEKKMNQVLIEKNEHNVELAEIIVKNKTVYFDNHNQFKDFIKEYSKKYERINFNENFWERESIKSMAAIRLTNKISQDRAIGVLFINFRTNIIFTKELKNLIETFASFASASMANIQVMERNIRYILDNMRLSKPIIQEFIAKGLLHNAKKSNDTIYTTINNIFSEWDKMSNLKLKKEFIHINEKLSRVQRVNEELDNQFNSIRDVYNPKETIFIKNINIIEVIKSVTDNFSVEFKSKHIVPEGNYTKYSNPITIECDENQIKMSVNNIIKNAIEASNSRGRIEINVKEKDEIILIEILDNGKVIEKEMISEMFEIYKTDKLHGTGLGLPISRHFIEINHRGSIKFKQFTKHKIFTITLPIKQNAND